MTKLNQLHNIKKVPAPERDIPPVGVNQKRVPYRRLDLIDTERYGQKTYNNKTYFIPTVYRGDGDIDVGLELVNYYQFTARGGPATISGTGIYENIFQSYELPSPVGYPDIDQYNANLIPIEYDGFDTAIIKQAGIYNVSFNYSVTLIEWIQSIEFKVTSSVKGVILHDTIAAGGKTITSTGTLTDGTISGLDSVGGAITGQVDNLEVISTYVLDDLSDLLVIYSGNGKKNLYLEEDEELKFTITVTSSTGGAASGIISSADVFLSYLRPNR